MRVKLPVVAILLVLVAARGFAQVPTSRVAAMIGSVAPEFVLQRTDGKNDRLSLHRGRVVVLVFGSYSSPSFRARAASIEALHRDSRGGVDVLVIYGAEAHPQDDWDVERNRDAGLRIDQPADLEARIKIASDAAEKLKLSVPVLVDEMTNPTAAAYDAGENSAVVIDRDGVVVAHQKWFDPTGLKRYIQSATTRPASRQ